MKKIDVVFVERTENGKVLHVYGGHYNDTRSIDVYLQTQDDPEAIEPIIKGVCSYDELIERLNVSEHEHMNYVWRWPAGNIIVGQKISPEFCKFV